MFFYGLMKLMTWLTFDFLTGSPMIPIIPLLSHHHHLNLLSFTVTNSFFLSSASVSRSSRVNRLWQSNHSDAHALMLPRGWKVSGLRGRNESKLAKITFTLTYYYDAGKTGWQRRKLQFQEAWLENKWVGNFPSLDPSYSLVAAVFFCYYLVVFSSSSVGNKWHIVRSSSSSVRL